MESKRAFVCRLSRESAFQFISRSRRMDWGQHKMEAPRSIRALIVEDEPLARQTIKDFVQGEDWLKVVGEAADGDSAITLIDDLRPDLVFLDVRMPGLTGLQVLESIKHDPEVVFTTAYDDHAVTAFELEALLDPKHFRRIHRSAIVNLDHVVTCKPIDRRLRLKLSDGSEVIASRSGSRNLRDLFV